jgi:BioD-like phosphotransacetylase family protein
MHAGLTVTRFDMSVPRVFIAATRQNKGKTTASLGFLTHLRTRFDSVGFMKPVGQRYVTLDNGTKVDKDVWLLRESFGYNDPPECMSPVTVPSKFTREYIDNRDPHGLIRRVQDAFFSLIAGKDFMLLEGTGHAGVGSVFDLSNARVARVLESPVVLVSGGGIGKPVDEIMLNYSLFKNSGVDVAGVIINKVLPEKMDVIANYVSRSLAWHDIDVLGVVPYLPLLSQPTLREVCSIVKGEFISGGTLSGMLFNESVIVSHDASGHMQDISPGTLVIAAGDQGNVLAACTDTTPEAKHCRETIAGILLVGGIAPEEDCVNELQDAGVPVILTDMSAFAAAGRVAGMVAKIQPDNPEKINAITRLFEEHVAIDRLLEKVS